MNYKDYFPEDVDELLSEEWPAEPKEGVAFIASIMHPKDDPVFHKASLEEMQRLAETADIRCEKFFTQKREHPDNKLYFGKGFLAGIAKEMKEMGVGTLIINDELSPSQGRNIENAYEIKVIDRSEVIITIFHRHALTKEARLQVKSAELKYQLPRLRQIWGEFEQERGTARTGGAASRGAGEKQIELDRRKLRQQIRKIDAMLLRISANKETQRKSRQGVKKICLVGYTNAGKSTLFNRLTDAGVLVEDKLFATLDSTSRQLKLSAGEPAVISDTVGFISDLPHHLIASFKATLMEATDADLLLHVVDVSDDRYRYYIEQVNNVLESIGAKDIPQILVFNKADLLSELRTKIVAKHHKDAVPISAKEGTGIEELLKQIEEKLYQIREYCLVLPYEQTGLVSKMHDLGSISVEDYREDGIHLKAQLPMMYQHLIESYITGGAEGENH